MATVNWAKDMGQAVDKAHSLSKPIFEIDDLNRAIGLLTEAFENHPQSFAAPQAVYFHGVCRYKQTHEADPLKKVEEKLQAKYPDSEWTQRAAPYKLL